MADQIINKQQLIDAGKNADSWEKYWSGNEDEDVITRLNKEYPTHAKALKILMENGGLQPFETQAELLASTPIVTPTAAKALDTKKVWIWKNGSWIDTGLSELDQAIEHTDSEIAGKVTSVIEKTEKEIAVIVIDDFENPILIINQDGQIYSPILDDSIQNLLNINQSKISDLNKNFLKVSGNNVAVLVDDSENLLYRFDKNSDFYISGISESVQSLLRKINEPTVTTNTVKDIENIDQKFMFSSAFLDRLNNTKATHSNVAQVPNFAARQRFEVNKTWINDVKVELLKSSDHVAMSGFDPYFRENIGVVHPQVWSFNESVAGYKYWLSINPYTNGNEDIELPFIYGSNDPNFKTWELIPTFPQPFEADPINEDGSNRGHLSDSGFCYDPKTGDLIYFWRKNLYYPSGSAISAKVGILASRWDGVKWSNKYELYRLTELANDGLMSPNIVYNDADDLFYMYYTQDGKLWYRTSKDIRSHNWSARNECIVDNGSGKFWHLDAKCIGDKLVILIHVDNSMSNSTDELLFAISSDFKTFSVSQNTIATIADPTIYKATFQPIFTSGNLAKFRIIYTSDSRTNPQYQMYVTDTNQINLGA